MRDRGRRQRGYVLADEGGPGGDRGWGRGDVLAKYDTNKNGQLDPDEKAALERDRADGHARPDRKWETEPVVVIRVLADQIHTARCEGPDIGLDIGPFPTPVF